MGRLQQFHVALSLDQVRELVATTRSVVSSVGQQPVPDVVVAEEIALDAVPTAGGLKLACGKIARRHEDSSTECAAAEGPALHAEAEVTPTAFRGLLIFGGALRAAEGGEECQRNLLRRWLLSTGVDRSQYLSCRFFGGMRSE